MNFTTVFNSLSIRCWFNLVLACLPQCLFVKKRSYIHLDDSIRTFEKMVRFLLTIGLKCWNEIHPWLEILSKLYGSSFSFWCYLGFGKIWLTRMWQNVYRFTVLQLTFHSRICESKKVLFLPREWHLLSTIHITVYWSSKLTINTIFVC